MTDATPGLAPPTVLIDTNVISYLIRRDTRGVDYGRELLRHTGALSFQTIAELLRWPLQYGWSTRRSDELNEYLGQFLPIPFAWPMADYWARIVAERNRVGRPIGTADAWIAATALALGVPLMTHNRRDFDGVAGLRLISFG